MSDSNPFAALAALKSQLPPGEIRVEAATTPCTADSPAPMFASKVVVLRQKKGRGGKTVTVIRGVLLGPPALKAFVKSLRKELGTGGSVDGTDVVLSGDQRERVAALLRERGAKQVVLSG